VNPVDTIHSLLHLKQGSTSSREPVSVGRLLLDLYPSSIHKVDEACLLLAVHEGEQWLWVFSEKGASTVAAALEGTAVSPSPANGMRLKQCSMNHGNACTLRETLETLSPVLIGPENSIGLGDRLGVAGPGHIRAVRDSGIRPVLAQQSIRELDRTRRTPGEVMDAATWAAFREGFHQGFGSDADHLKTTEDIDLMVGAGYTLFTIDPGDHVDNQADRYDAAGLEERMEKLPWQELEGRPGDAVSRYAGKEVLLESGPALLPSELDVARAWVKYGHAVASTVRLYRYLQDRAGHGGFELEVSVDETESVTTPFEHYFMAAELRRLGVAFVGLAPRFTGDFEKGVDYRGDPADFREAYASHLAISRMMGGYKISFHSGSDKFSVYRMVADFPESRFHIKTAGTSYLEALRTVAGHDPDLFRRILDFSRDCFPRERATYHVSAEIHRVPQGRDCADRELEALLDQDDARQVLHVAFGRVLTAEGKGGNRLFKDAVMDCLHRNEDAHHRNLERHIRRHLAPFV